jgi:hypothetical protein
MHSKKWLLAMLFAALPLALGGVAIAKQAGAHAPTAASGYICPINGEELPCPHCCVLK